MATTKRAANRHTVVATGWTNPDRAYGTSSDNVSATLASAKNSTLSGDFGFPDVTTAAVSYDINLPITLAAELTYANGYWVAVGATGTLCYATSPTGPWTLHSNSFGATTVATVGYFNGYWLVPSSSADGIWYRNATDPAGTWTKNSVATMGGSAMTYGNGYWVVCQSNKVWWATDPTGTWTSVTLPTSDIALCAYFANNYFVVGGGASASYFHYRLADPTGTWTANTNTGTSPQETVIYANGYWVIGGDTQRGYLNSTDPTGSFTMTAVGGIYSGMVYVGSNYIAARGGGISEYASDPTGAWTNVSTPAKWSSPFGTTGVATDGTNVAFVTNTGGGLKFASTTDITSPTWVYPTEAWDGIPDGSTINSVTIQVGWFMGAVVTGGALGCQPRTSNANSGTELVNTTATAGSVVEETATFTPTPTLANLRASETSDVLEARVRVTKGSTNSAMTGSLDYIDILIDFTAPAASTVLNQGFVNFNDPGVL